MGRLKKKNKGIIKQLSSAPSNASVMFGSHTGRSDAFHAEIEEALEHRSRFQVMRRNDDDEEEDVTPQLITETAFTAKFQSLREHVLGHLFGVQGSSSSVNLPSHASSRLFTKLSIDDILEAIGSTRIVHDSEMSLWSSTSSLEFEWPEYTPAFLKLMLRKTDVILLYEQVSVTAARGTAEGTQVDMENKNYDYMTTGKGKIRRRNDGEAQTTRVLCKSRSVNTTNPKFATVNTYVGSCEMYETFERIRHPVKVVKDKEEVDDDPDGEFKARKNELVIICDTAEFKLASRIMNRVLASNRFRDGQRRFRIMDPDSRLATNVDYTYSLSVMFRFKPHAHTKQRKAVADISFCPSNGDILAVAYGIYSFSAQHLPTGGYVRVWSIKNPVNPERFFYYDVPVLAVEFSQFQPVLLAIGLYNGTVEVRDITNVDAPPLAVSQRGVSPGCEPVVAIRWIKEMAGVASADVEPFLALFQNGAVTKYRVINSPFLIAFKQMELERVEGNPEGLMVEHLDEVPQQANRHPQALSMTMHPVQPDLYYLLTDEGCLHKCSTNYPHQYLEVLKTHDGSVNTMDFSPWSPKLYITSGNDWNIRVWMEGIFKPLITLTCHLAPVHCAYWSRTHSTMIVALSRHYVDIWDLKRNILQPMSTTELDSSFNTFAKFAKCGRTLAVGNERGNLLMCGIEHMPFTAHYQYDELEKTLFQCLGDNKDLIFEVRSMGYFGYPREKKRITRFSKRKR